ncbi:MAG: glucokinase [Woeseiaceae bacterium]|nr:glucokinase [Woeseiaceae bacterium]
MSTWLLADVGGTNTRIACWRAGTSPRMLDQPGRYRNAGFSGLQDILAAYLDAREGTRPTRALLAVAGPVVGQDVRLLNIDWTFSVSQLAESLGMEDVTAINDFHAQARALPLLGDDERTAIGSGTPVAGAAMAVLGPGTGLGVAGLTPDNYGGYAVVSGEGGHASLAAFNRFEDELLAEARARCGHCSAERLISGTGLTLLHDILHGEAGVAAEELGKRATGGEPAAVRTLSVCFDLLGTVAGNVALTLGARGGLYIAGGIALANRELFMASGFRERFVDKGRYRNYLQAIPTWLVTAPTPALFGLALEASQANRLT